MNSGPANDYPLIHHLYHCHSLCFIIASITGCTHTSCHHFPNPWHIQDPSIDCNTYFTNHRPCCYDNLPPKRNSDLWWYCDCSDDLDHCYMPIRYC